ncbi:ABC transporter ATP-binding protein [Nocardia blacklockiae]|uniref:ABC transporter ATP-binding protein n=1 Tax=Nocardia blacklockiae TaxID=480036 RepID=UPI001895E6E5|nr:ABC transporter ATP-binding protein [Nocardia blacklockiae]MBF6174383.1 ABC transporter ATP-binding protein [Nocardia blacklockiae]
MTAPNPSPAIAVEHLRVHRGGREVLHDVSLTVPRGCITGLLGPSGCGKTTLMRSIVGTQLIEAGSVRVLGEPAGSAGLRSRVGYVTQAPSIYDDLTVTDNVSYFGALYGRSGAEVTAAIDSVGLGPHARQRGNQLSGGQRTRASLACALVADPEVLVLDEPTVGLDPVLRVELWDQFHALAAQGRTLLVSSHVMDEAEHCDRLLLMRDGQLLAQLTPDELRADTGESSLENAFLALIRMGEPR